MLAMAVPPVVVEFQACEVISCAMKMKKGRSAVSFKIAETCRHFHANDCPYKRIYDEQHPRGDADQSQA